MRELTLVAAPKPWFVYALVLRNGDVYFGASNKVEKRVAAHSRGVASKCTRSQRPLKHVATSPAMGKGDALQLEAFLKSLTRAEKLAWIAKHTIAGVRKVADG